MCCCYHVLKQPRSWRACMLTWSTFPASSLLWLQDAKKGAAANLPTHSPSTVSVGGSSADAAVEIPDVQSGADRSTGTGSAAAAVGKDAHAGTVGPAAVAPAGACCSASADIESCQQSDAAASTSGECKCCGCAGRLCDNSADKSEVRMGAAGTRTTCTGISRCAVPKSVPWPLVA